MPHSSPEGKPEFMKFFREHFNQYSTVLDVGPGAGFYGETLKHNGFYYVDAVEIFEPYIEQFALKRSYRNVYVGDIRTFEFPQHYDLVILGDVLEHLSVEDSQILTANLPYKCSHAVFSVPWEYPQDPIGGNEAERHLQPDLTPEVMSKRYPLLRLFHSGPNIGLYTLTGLQ